MTGSCVVSLSRWLSSLDRLQSGSIGAGSCEAMSVKTTAKNATRNRRRPMKDFVKAIQIPERREGEMAIGTSGAHTAGSVRFVVANHRGAHGVVGVVKCRISLNAFVERSCVAESERGDGYFAITCFAKSRTRGGTERLFGFPPNVAWRAILASLPYRLARDSGDSGSINAPTSRRRSSRSHLRRSRTTHAEM